MTTSLRFKIGADVRTWTEFEIIDPTPEEIALISLEDDEAVAHLRALYEGESPRLVQHDREVDDDPDLFADYASPAILDVEEVTDASQGGTQ